MGEISTQAAEAFRDYSVDGLPASGAHDPVKEEIREVFRRIDDTIQAVVDGEGGVSVEINAGNYDTYGEASGAAVDAGKSLRLWGNSPVPVDTVAAADVSVYEGGTITVSSGKTLTMRGRILNDPTHQIFFGAGVVKGLRRARPEWFGWSTSNTAAQNTAAWDRMIVAMNGNDSFDTPGDGNDIVMSAGAFDAVDMKIYPTVYDNFRIMGAGQTIGGTTINFHGAGDDDSAGLQVIPTAPGQVVVWRIQGLNLVNADGCPIPLKIGATGANSFQGLENSVVTDVLVQGLVGATTAQVLIVNSRVVEVNRVTVRNPVDGVKALVIRADGASAICGDNRVIDLEASQPSLSTDEGAGSVYMEAINGGGLTGNKFESCTFYRGRWAVDIFVGEASSCSDTWIDKSQFEGSPEADNGFGALRLTMEADTSICTNLSVTSRCWMNAMTGPEVISIINPEGGYIDTISISADFRNCHEVLGYFRGVTGALIENATAKDSGFPLTQEAAFIFDDCVRPTVSGFRAWSTTGADGYDHAVQLTGSTRGARIGNVTGHFAGVFFDDQASGPDNQFLDAVTGGAQGVARGDLGNVTPVVGRGALGLSGFRSLSEIAQGLSPTNYSNALEALLQEAADDGLAVYVPPGQPRGLINRTIHVDVNGKFQMWGEAGLSMFKSTGINAPMLEFEIQSQVLFADDFMIRNVRGYNDLASLSNEASCFIKFIGDELLLYPRLDNVSSIGCYAVIVNDMGTFPSPYGDENYLNHKRAHAPWGSYHPSVVNAKYGWWDKNGSGTGGILTGLSGEYARTGTASGDICPWPAAYRCDGGAGVVVGDFYYDGNLTSANSFGASWDGSMAHQNNIREAPNTHIDAGVKGSVLIYPAAANPGYGVHSLGMKGGNIGVAQYIGRTQGSMIWHQGVQFQPAGVFKEALTVGQEVEALTADLSAYSGGMVAIFATGLVQGKGGRQVTGLYALSTQDTGAGATPVAVPLVSGGSPAAQTDLTIVTSVSGSTITFKVANSATADGSKVEIQAWPIGGSAKYSPGERL